MIEFRKAYAKFGREFRINGDPIYNRIPAYIKRFTAAVSAAEIAVVGKDDMVKQKFPQTYFR